MPKRARAVVVNNQDLLDDIMANAVYTTDTSLSLDQRIDIFMDRWLQLEAGYDDISQHSKDYQGKFNVTVRNALTEIAAAQKLIQTQIDNLESIAAKRRNFAAKVVIDPSTDPHRGDGTCYIHFVNVGMGDCTIIATPLGRTIMIDCGSDSLADVILDPNYDPETDPGADDYIRNTVKAPTFLHGANTIDLLFLTHSDSDHHNRLETILKPVSPSIGLVYYGAAKIENFVGTSAYLKKICGTTNAVLRRVTIAEKPTLTSNAVVVTKAINDVAVTKTSGNPGQPADEFIDPATGAMVVFYESDPKSDFRISLLSGNVTGAWVDGVFTSKEADLKSGSEMKLNSTPANRRGLMVLIECFGKTVLVCGDATTVTERFAVDYMPNALGKVQALRMAHHGSPTSSGRFFIKAMPKLASVFTSTGGENTVLHYLPKLRILNEYVKKVQTTADQHDIYAFDSGDLKSQLYFTKITNWLYCTGSDDTVAFPIKKT